MIKAEIDKTKGILHARPSGPLEAADFDRLAALADPYIAQKGELAGLLIEVKEFPGWKNLAGMVKHFRFVRNHHRKIRQCHAAMNRAAAAVAIDGKNNAFNVANETPPSSSTSRQQTTCVDSDVRPNSRMNTAALAAWDGSCETVPNALVRRPPFSNDSTCSGVMMR